MFAIIAAALLIGLVFYRKPADVIEFQRKFYLFINWKLEPVSMQKEIRNTKAMGLFVVFLGALAVIYAVCRL